MIDTNYLTLDEAHADGCPAERDCVLPENHRGSCRPGRHELTEVIPAFLDTFAETEIERTVELEAIATAPDGLVHRAGRWVTRNLTRTRVSALLLSVAVLAVVGGLWVVAR